jgi:hypothetical protein
MYQQVLRRFGQFNCIRLSTPAPLDQLLLIALDEEEALGRWQPNDGPKEEIAKVGSPCLVKTTAFLREDDSSRGEECCMLASETLDSCPEYAERVWSSGTLAARRWAGRRGCKVWVLCA